MKISVIGPVLNEVQFIGYSIMATLPYMHEYVYALDEKSNDGTRELLAHIKAKYAHERLIILETPNFHPSEKAKYNAAFNACIERSTGDACWFLHPDMIVTNPEAIANVEEGPLAWWVNVTSYARDFDTVITKGRTTRWKNIHAKDLGLHYFGGYGSQNEDFYHSEITGNAYKHYGDDFAKYPFQIANSEIELNHYCELKPYARRLEKMKYCLKTQNPQADENWIEDRAIQHPRVTLEPTLRSFGDFEFKRIDTTLPDVFTKYRAEFEAFKKEPISA